MHVTTVRVRYAETDQAGVAHHASFLPWLEVGRTEMLRDAGYPYSRLESEDGVFLTVTEVGLHFHLPARYDELLVVESTVTDVRRVRVRIATTIRRQAGSALLSSGHVWLACVEGRGRPVPIPAGFLATLRSLASRAGKDDLD
jgi:acyl-CoA thioester hydrolase